MNTMTEAQIEADPTLPIIRMFRDFSATPAQLVRAHTDPELFAQWVGPNGMDVTIEAWDARTGGSWRYSAGAARTPSASTAASTRCVTTGSCRPSPSTACPTAWPWRRLTFEDLGDGRTRLHAQSLCAEHRGA